MLGLIAWWQVLEPTIKQGDLPELCKRFGLGDPPPSQKMLDVFRRNTTARTKREYTLTPQISIRLDLHLNPDGARHKLEVRDVVRTQTRGSARKIQEMDKVGTLVYDRRTDKVGLGVEQHVLKLPDRKIVEEFIVGIRDACVAGVDEVDAQAGRRLVRKYLSTVDALLFEGGPYFIPRTEDAEGLMELLDALGGSTGFYTPMIEGPRERSLLAITQGKAETK